MAAARSVLMVAGTSILAGGERNLLDLSTAALAHGLEVGLVAPGEGELTARMRSLGCPVWDVAMPKVPLPTSIRRVREVLAREGFGLVHAHGHLAGMYARLAARKLAGIKTAYTLHGIHYPHYRNAVKKWAFIAGERVLKRDTDLFICVCKSDLLTGRELGIVEVERTRVIYNGIDPEGGTDPERAAGLRGLYGRGGGLILHAGRFMPQKDHRTLIASIPLVLEESPGAVFLLAGSGPLLETEKEHAARLGIPRDALVFLGESGEVADLLAACDLFVLPSLWEGFPYVILEAMQAAKPVVVTGVGGSTEAISDGENGIIIKPRDPQELAGAIIRLLGHTEEAAAMGRRGRERLNDFSLDNMAAATLAGYEQLMQQRP